MDDETPLTPEERELAARGELLISEAVAGSRASHSLREAIERERQRAAAPPRPYWRRHLKAVAGAAAAAAIAAGIGVTLSVDSDNTEPTLASVESAAAAEATEPPPEPIGGEPPVLAASVGELEYPDWRKSFGWTASGRRDDELSGRTVTTVFYRNPDGARFGYSVVDGEPLSERAAGRVVNREGKSYTVDDQGEQTVVTWTQEGHTCVIAAPSAVPASQLVKLAASRNV